MATRHRTIERVSDLLDLGEKELVDCLASLRGWVRNHRAKVGDAQRQGFDAAAIAPEPFVWRPKEAPSAPDPKRPLAADTDVGELGLRPSAAAKLRELNIYTLEDCSEASARELRCLPNVGHSTVARIRDLLHAVNLDFKEAENAMARAADRARVARAVPAAERRKTVNDGTALEDAGFATRIVEVCMSKKIRTVGQLRACTLHDLYPMFGKTSLTDLLETLESLEMPLTSQPGQLERWRFGAIRQEALVRPADDQPTHELRPWLGAECEHLKRAGLLTVGDVKKVALAGGTKIAGIGPHGWDRIAAYFSAPLPKRARR